MSEHYLLAEQPNQNLDEIVENGNLKFSKTDIEKVLSGLWSFILGVFALLANGTLGYGMVASFEGTLTWVGYMGLGLMMTPFTFFGCFLIYYSFRVRGSIRKKWDTIQISPKEITITGERLDDPVIIYSQDLKNVKINHIRVKRNKGSSNRFIIHYLYVELFIEKKKYVLGNIHETRDYLISHSVRGRLEDYLMQHYNVEINRNKAQLVFLLIFFLSMVMMIVGLFIMI